MSQWMREIVLATGGAIEDERFVTRPGCMVLARTTLAPESEALLRTLSIPEAPDYARLAELSSELGAETGRPIHKDFHHQHVFVAERASVIDFDEVCLGDPNFDLGHFCAYLALLGCRVPARVATLARRRDEFLTSYDRRAGWRRDGRLAAFYAYTCLKIAKQLCTAAGVLPRPHGEEEHRQTAAMLQEGLAALDRGF